jgi:hypothetical protein
MALVDSRIGDLELSLKLYHPSGLQVGYQQLMTEAPPFQHTDGTHLYIDRKKCTNIGELTEAFQAYKRKYYGAR